MAKKKTLFAFFTATALTVLALAPLSGAAMVLKVSSCLPTNHDLTETYLKAFHEPFNQLAKGEVKLDYIGGPEVTPPRKQATALKRGLIDVIFCPPAYYQGIVAEAGVLPLSNLPPKKLRETGAFDLLQPIWAKELNASILGWCCYGIDFHIYTTFEPKESMTTGLDLSGVKMRSTGSYNAFFKAMGATPVNMSATEIYTGLQRGVVEGFAWPQGSLSKMGVQKLIKYRVYPGFFNVANLVIINLDKLNALPNATQAKLVQVGMDFDEKSPVMLQKKVDADNEKLFKAGMKKYELKGQPRKAYVKTIYDAKWKESAGRKYQVPLDKLKAAIYVEQ